MSQELVTMQTLLIFASRYWHSFPFVKLLEQFLFKILGQQKSWNLPVCDFRWIQWNQKMVLDQLYNQVTLPEPKNEMKLKSKIQEQKEHLEWNKKQSS